MKNYTINASEIHSNSESIALSSGIITINDDGTLHLHDGSTAGGIQIGGGSGGIPESGGTYNLNSGASLVVNATSGTINFLNNAVAGIEIGDTTRIYSNNQYAEMQTNGTFAIPGTLASGATTGAVIIKSNDGTTTRTWTFGTDGSLSIPQSNSGAGLITSGSNGIQLTANSVNWQLNPDGSTTIPGIITLPNSQGQIGVNSNTGLDIYNNVLSYGYVKLNYNDQSIVQADSNGVTITTVNSPSTSWNFSNSNGGSITFPDDTTQNTAFELQGLPPLTAWGTYYPATTGTANLDYMFFFDPTTGYPTIQSYATAGGNPIYNSIYNYEAWLAASSSANPTAGSNGLTPIQINNTGGVNILGTALQPGDYVTLRIQCLDTGRIFRATFMGAYNSADGTNPTHYGSITVERLL